MVALPFLLRRPFPCGDLRLVGVAALVLLAAPARAQTPFPLYDPFYFDETARLGYDDAYAVSGDVAFRPSATAPDASALATDAFVFAGRLDLRLGRLIDVGALVDASSQGVGRTLQWSWATARYAWTTDDGGAQAFRLAVDPGTDGSVGFPLVDFAFFSTSAQAQPLATNFGIGVRRVQRGYQRFVPVVSQAPSADFDVRFERAFGWELRATLAAGYVFDAAGSRLYASVTGMRGVYDLQTLADSTTGTAAATRELRSTAAWVQLGVAFDRPSVRLAPYVRVPFYATESPDATAPALAVGLQLTLR